MSAVGDLLELLYGASDRWETLQCTSRHWQHVARGQIATERWLAHRRGASVQYAGGGGPQPETYEHEQRLWIAKPDRVRQEFDEHVSVTRGDLWWSWSPHQGFMTNEGDPEVGMSNPLHSFAASLDPATLIPQIAIERIEGGTIHVRPRTSEHYGPGLPGGADAHVLTLDERGIVIRTESFVDGDVFSVHELEDAIWDEEIPDEVFTLQLPEGEEARSPRDVHARLSVEEAAARAGFTVFTVAELPEGQWRVDAHYHPAMRDMKEQLTLLYSRVDGRRHLQLLEHAAGTDHPWARLQGAAHVDVERDGTHITLQSEHFDEEELQGLADGLVRA